MERDLSQRAGANLAQGREFPAAAPLADGAPTEPAGLSAAVSTGLSDGPGGLGKSARPSLGVLAASGLLGVLYLGLVGRLLAFPIGRDENLFITVSRLWGTGDIYRDFGYNHLPYLPYLLGGLYWLTGTGHFLLLGRLLIAAAWALAIAALWLIARRQRTGFPAFFAAAVLLMGNVLLIGPPGMMVSNNFLPLPFALLAIHFLLCGLDRERPSWMCCFVAGVLVSIAVGFKANYIFLAPFLAAATLFAPLAHPLRQRLVCGIVPLALGGLTGGIPVLIAIASDPDAFFAHTIRYFTQLQPNYWMHSTEPKVVGLAQKILLAEDIWTANATLLALAGAVVLVALPLRRRGWRDGLLAVWSWPVVLAAALALMGVIVAFVPSPSFPQYFVPPIPFLVLLVLVLRARTLSENRLAADAVLLSLAVVAVLCAASRLGPGMISLTRPGSWVGVKIHGEMRGLVRSAGASSGDSVATFSPLLAVEGGLGVPGEFAAGQFVYRVADYMPPHDRVYWTTTSPTRLTAWLDANRPATILVSGEEPLEQPLADYARSHGYLEFASRRNGTGPVLYRRPLKNDELE
ncbi:MAG: hypothetical protein DI555_02240 [Novosphingobium pentaromativorans]|uniref:Glycosyltransferase RgtA/B/C/D-like domain-containing protein n=1 Tax=Novosphingobium pentaromativorans TaxID=205844 RepID=A0A2W5NYJ4_9SPHN|nr:hypothetical protein [Novosphingobium panipatense]PZQ56969.1 MAG: hypothetical protein DI555_02240 [Novosphingobium pentaromativorans]